MELKTNDRMEELAIKLAKGQESYQKAFAEKEEHRGKALEEGSEKAIGIFDSKNALFIATAKEFSNTQSGLYNTAHDLNRQPFRSHIQRLEDENKLKGLLNKYVAKVAKENNLTPPKNGEYFSPSNAIG